MRIIAGKARRTSLKAPPGEAVRPTADRVKETLFAMLEPLAGLRVLDLFAGSGALGLEAYSRGAEYVVLVERNPRHIDVIRANLAAAVHAAAEPDPVPVRVAPGDVRIVARRLAELAGSFDLILADPPYSPARGEYGAADLLGDAEFAAWAGTRPILMIEHDADTALPLTSSWHVLKQRQCGRTMLSFYRQSGSRPPPDVASP